MVDNMNRYGEKKGDAINPNRENEKAMRPDVGNKEGNLTGQKDTKIDQDKAGYVNRNQDLDQEEDEA